MKTNNVINRESIIKPSLNYKKSNILISSKYRSSLLENKILTLALATAYEDEGRVIAKLSTSELKMVLNKKQDNKKISGSFYTQLKNVACEMTGRKIFIEDEVNKSFVVANLVGSATYKDNELTIKFEPDLKDYILNLQSNYTNMNVAILMSFNKVYSYRLYELLKSKAFSYAKNVTNNEYSVCYGLSELKLTLGVVDTNAEAVSRALKKSSPDFDRIVNEVSKNKNFEVWSDFQKRVITPAINEINEKSDILVNYKVVREGYGGKITKIIFLFKKKDCFEIPSYFSEVHKIKEAVDELIIEEVKSFIEEPVTNKEVQTLLRVAKGDVNKIRNAYNFASKQSHIDNLIGWMRAAIKNGYEDESIEKNKDMTYKDTVSYNKMVSELLSTG